LITVVLTWGSDFAKDKLSTTQTSINDIDLTGLITSRSISSQNILISNNHSSKDLNITGYKIISSLDHYLYEYFENKIYYLDDPLLIGSKQAEVLEIDCYPEDSFFIDLLTDQNTYVRTQVLSRSINDVDSFRCGLVGYWKFDGDAKDSSRFKNDGIINGATITSGKINEAFYFRGHASRDHINLGNSPVFDIVGPMSVSFWIRYDPHTQDSRYDFIFGRSVSGVWGDNPFIFLRVHSHDNRLYFYIQDDSSIKTEYSGYFPPLNEWVFITGIYDGENLKLYVDGLLKTSVPSTITELKNVSGSDLTVGGNKNIDDRSFHGAIDDLRIYNRALLLSEIIDLYEIS